MDRVLQATQDIRQVLENGKFKLASTVTSTASGIAAFTAPATQHGLQVLLITPGRLEEYGRGLGASAGEKVREQLFEIDPSYVHQYDEVWRELSQGSPERLRSAAHLMRELLKWVLMRLAPDAEVKSQSWYTKPKDSTLDVVRSQRIRYLFGTQPENRKYVDALITLTRMEIDSLHEGIHADPAEWNDKGQIERAIRSVDDVLLRILTERTR